MTLQEKVNSIKTSKEAIKAAITEKTGSDAGNVLADYANLISGITTGGNSLSTSDSNYSALKDPDYPDLSSLTINQGEIYFIVDNRDNNGYIYIGGLLLEANNLKYGYIENNAFVETETGNYSGYNNLSFCYCEKYFGSSYDKFVVCKVSTSEQDTKNGFRINSDKSTITEIYINLENDPSDNTSLLILKSGYLTSNYTEKITFKNCCLNGDNILSNISSLRQIVFKENCKIINCPITNPNFLRVLDIRGVDTTEMIFQADKLEYCRFLEEIYSDDKNIFLDLVNTSSNVQFNRLRKFPVPDSITETINLSYVPQVCTETINTIINNLYDYTGTENTYIVAFNSLSSYKVSEEYRAIAADKGWTLAY